MLQNSTAAHDDDCNNARAWQAYPRNRNSTSRRAFDSLVSLPWLAASTPRQCKKEPIKDQH